MFHVIESKFYFHFTFAIPFVVATERASRANKVVDSFPKWRESRVDW